MSVFFYLTRTGELDWMSRNPIGEPNIVEVWYYEANIHEEAILMEQYKVIIGALSHSCANIDSVKEWTDGWELTGENLVTYLATYFVRWGKPSEEYKIGVERFMTEILEITPDDYWSWLESTPKGQEPDFKNMPCKDNFHG